MSQEEFDELVVYVSGLKRFFTHKMDDHLFIIQQQNNRIEEQNRVIDELAWQIRDLRASVRQLGSQVTKCVCNYENHEPKFKKSLDPSKARSEFVLRNKREITEEENDDDIYEPINFPARDYVPKPSQLLPVNQPSTSQKSTTNKEKSNQPVRNIAIAPYATVNVDVIKAKHQRSMEKLTQAETASKIENLFKNIHLDGDNRKINNDLTEDEDQFLRQKEMKSFARLSKRGSSRVLCSLMSDIEEEYLPRENELTEENFHHISREVVSDAVVDYRLSNDESKRNGFMLQR